MQRRLLLSTPAVSMIVLIVTVVMIPLTHMQAEAGDLDLAFGSGGKVFPDFGGAASAKTVILEPDGKIIVGGPVFHASGDFGLIRFNTDGSLDPTFGSGGKVITNFFTVGGFESFDSLNALVLQPDGRIIAAGTSFDNGRFVFALARYNNDGSLDTSFGESGKLVTSPSPFDSGANAVALQPDGKIIAAGSVGRSFSSPPMSDFALIRYDSKGGLDLAFGNGGVVATDILHLAAAANSIVLQPDGRIVVGGATQVVDFLPTFFIPVLARYNGDGSLDASFGTGGTVRVPIIATGSAIALQADGKIVVAGSFIDSSSSTNRSSDFALVRLNRDGSIDDAFGKQGRATADFDLDDDEATALAVDPLGRIVAVGGAFRQIGRQERGEFAVARFISDGRLDRSFASDGKASYNFFGFADEARAVTLQTDGKIVAVGDADRGTQHSMAILRFSGGPAFNLCVQDDSNGNLLQINTTTGEYQFTNCAGLTIGGTGTLTKRGNQITLQHNGSDRRVMASIDSSTKRAIASIQLLSQGRTFGITDRNITNNTCACR
jgi:uncharacterized delta-60 repeat protein